MYPSSYIITCNVHFFTHSIIFFGRKAHVLSAWPRAEVSFFFKWEQKDHCYIKPVIPTLFTPVDHSSLQLVLDPEAKTLESKRS